MWCVRLLAYVIVVTSYFTIPAAMEIFALTSSGNVVSRQESDAATIYENFIEELDEILSFPPFTSINKLDWSNAGLTKFPDLQNVSWRIADIALNYNKISYIPPNLMDILGEVTLFCIRENLLTSFPATSSTMNLRSLYINGNPINEMPDFGTAAETLRTLSMPGTDVSVFRSNLTIFSALTSLDMKNGQLTDLPPCQLLPQISGTGMKLKGNPLESFDTTDRNFGCVNFNEGFSGAQFTSIPNLCKTNNLPANVEWADAPDVTMIDCDCSALWLKVGLNRLECMLTIYN